MENKIELIQGNNETTEVSVLKVPYTFTDDFGNTSTQYRKETVDKTMLLNQRAYFEKQLAIINEKLSLLPDMT